MLKSLFKKTNTLVAKKCLVLGNLSSLQKTIFRPTGVVYAVQDYHASPVPRYVGAVPETLLRVLTPDNLSWYPAKSSRFAPFHAPRSRWVMAGETEFGLTFWQGYLKMYLPVFTSMAIFTSASD